MVKIIYNRYNLLPISIFPKKMQNSTCTLKKFSMRSITFDPRENKGPVIILLGKRDTGKSFLIRDLLFYHQDIPIGTVISGTEAGNGFFGSHVPKLFIHDEYCSKIIENILRRQKTVLKQVTSEVAQYGRTNIDPRTFVILDDCLYDNTWARDKLMRLLFLNGRHWKVMLIISMQYPLGIPPMLRSNIDYVFILRENVLSNRKRIWENYASMFPTLDAFCAIMDQTTENYECLVIYNSSKSNQLNEQVYWYKAESHGDFRLGAQEFWDMSAQLAGDSDDEGGSQYNPANDRAKKRGGGGTITVKKTKW